MSAIAGPSVRDAMIRTALYLTAAQVNGQVPVRGAVKLDAQPITQENADDWSFPESPFRPTCGHQKGARPKPERGGSRWRRS